MENRFEMKSLEIADVDHIMTWVNDPEVVKNLQHFDKTLTREDELSYINKILSSKNDFVFSFFDGSEYVGQGGMHQISWENKLGRVSIMIARKHWGKGYGQEILKRLINHAFKELGLHKIWLMHWKENKKAEHIYKKLGFKKEGILKDEYYWQGQYHDMVRMAIINEKDI